MSRKRACDIKYEALNRGKKTSAVLYIACSLLYSIDVGDTPQPAVLSLRYTLILQGLELLSQPAAFLAVLMVC